MNNDFINYYRNELLLSESDFSKLIESFKIPLPITFRFTNHPLSTKTLEKYHKNFEKIPFFENTYKLINKFKEFNTLNELGIIIRQELVSMIPVSIVDIRETDIILDMCAAPGSKTTQILEKCKNLVIANDNNCKRINILRTQTNKIKNPALIITSYDARSYPNIYIPEMLKYDKIFCDVPCSGDATYRKNNGNWKKANFFKLQSSILKRASKLIKNDGIIIYSTCSLNPKENENVIRSLDGFELIEMKVEKNGEYFLRNGMKVRPGIGDDMKKCIRIYPHDNDTGGFFIAILRKIGNKEEEKNRETKIENKEMKNEGEIYKKVDNEILENLSKIYKIDKNNIYLTTENQKEITQVTSLVYKISKTNLRIEALGCKIFKKCFKNTYRISISKYFENEFVIKIDEKEFRKLIENGFIDYKSNFKNQIVFLSFEGIIICGFSNGESIFVFLKRQLIEILYPLFLN